MNDNRQIRNPNTKAQVSKWVFTPHTPWICIFPNGHMIYCTTWAGAMRIAREGMKP